MLSSSKNLLKIFVFFLILALISAIPLRQWIEDYDESLGNVDGMAGAPEFLSFGKRNIAIGRGDGLRPGK
ncbi:unnamed protein product [Caenorhabditis angaria]|uniref:Uncharacterized protein n=1 Tax=Caenorhabditis angaria TaxID=860376 RepID=A0A9P1IXB4_9PELO|nr:unnamed protein product [Caenorhabditis angaria]